MLFKDLIGKYEGATIGVIGSGPSLNEYKGRINSLCDIVIACNGSLMALNPNKQAIDYFLCADEFSPTRNWFFYAEKFRSSDNENVVTIEPHFLIPFDRRIKKDFKSRLQFNFRQFMEKRIGDRGNYLEIFNQYIDFLSTKRYTEESEKLERVLRAFFNYEQGAFKSMLYDYRIPTEEIESIPISLQGFYEEFERKTPIPIILRDFNGREEIFFMNGTISAIGTQIAKKLGAKKIQLFGCDFNNFSGSNYARGSSKFYYGKTSNRCKEVFDEYILSLQNEGIEVVHQGKTNLENPTIIK